MASGPGYAGQAGTGAEGVLAEIMEKRRGYVLDVPDISGQMPLYVLRDAAIPWTPRAPV